jgi:hypothetical protein
MINHELIHHNNKMYFVYRKYKASLVKDDKVIELMKLLECDIVLKKTNPDVILYYLKEIPELEILS